MAQTALEQSPRILVVDDDRPFLCTLEDMLVENGYSVETAGDGAAAYRKLKAETFDMVLTDLHMPGMSGLELLEKISRENMQVTPVLMSSLLSGDIKLYAVQKGVYAHLDKPFSVHRLFSIIESSMKEKQEIINRQ